MKRRLFVLRPAILVAAIFTAAFLAFGHRSWLSREVVVSVGLKAPGQIPCQIFYTDEPGMSFAPAKAVVVSARPNGNPVRVALPVKRLERLRFDFGIAPGTVRAGPVTLAGRETHVLDWREFTIRNDIGRFDVSANGAVNVESVGDDPYAIRPEPIGVQGRLHVNAFAFAVLVLSAAFACLALAAIHASWRRFASAPRKERIKAAAFLAAASALVAARFALVARMPPWFGASAWDDLWFVNAADSLLRGEWLGDYGQHTLCKGCFGPMTMAGATILGIPFLVAETILFVLGCAMFVYVLSRFVRNRVFLLLAFAVLLFNPTSISLVSFQRIYRNGMPLWQVPLVFGCLFMTYRSAHGPTRRMAAWAIASGIALWAFQNTREDGIWLWPFALVCLAAAAARAYAATATRKAGIARAATCLAPLVVLIAGNAALCAANWRMYGVPIRNDRDAGNYAKAMRDLYLMAPDPEDEARLSSPEHAGHYHNIYYSTLCKAYDVSPTLASARSGIDNVIARWARFQGYSGMDLRHDHMLFAIRDGAAKAGIYGSLPRSERFFGDVHRELSAAFADGRLSRRGFSFTAMAAPFRWEFVPGILREWRRALSSVASFTGVEAECKGGGQPGRDTAANDMLGAFRRASLHDIPDDGGGTAARTAVERANKEVKAYSAVARWALPAALGVYLFLSAAIFRRRVNRGRLLDWWLLATGILGSLMLHTACIAYMSATTFQATNYYYLAPSGQLALMFATVVAGMCVSAFGKKSPRGGFDKTDMLNDPHADEAALASANIYRFKMRRLLSVFIAVLLVASFLAVRHRAWLVRSVSVSVDLKFRESSFCQMFYTDSEDAGSRFERPVTVFVKPGGAHVVFSPPSDRLERIRFDFGNSPGNVRASPVVVEGEETRILDWRDFTVRHDIARFAVDTKGAVDIESVGGDPYAMSPEPLGLRGRLHTNGFVFSCLIFAALFVWWFLAGPRGVLWNTVPAESESVCTGPFFVLALVFVAARFVLVARIPAFFGPSPWDDGWFVNAAAALLRGEWLGSYDQYTLCKGCFGPMVAACASLFSIPFLVAETGLYVLGCAYFVRLLSKLVRIRFLLLAVFAFLLFNPASFSFMTWQRVYRNGMPLWQVPIVFGSLFSVYLAARGKIRGILPRALFAGAALWAFSNTREDAIWIAPFAVACLTVSAVRAWRCGSAKPDKTYRALACLLPIVVVLAGNAALCLVNHRVYGLPLRNDRDAGNYAKAMRDLYLIEPDTEEEARLSGPEHADHHHNIYYSTLCKAYDESPTLRGERRQIDQAIDDSAKADGYSERDLHLDHMLFAIRLGIFRAGHYASLPESEAFWGNVHKELDAAFRDGRLRRRGFSVTAMSAPLRSKFVPRICREWFQALRFVSTFGGTGAVATLPDLPGQPRSAYPHMVPVFGTAACETTVRNESLSVVQSAIARANVLSRYYSSSMSWIIGAALAAYACLSVLLALGRLRTSGLEDWWLFATGILASILVHTACIGYVSATTFGATSTHYLAASYQLALMFVVVVAGSYVAVSGKHGGPSKREIK